MGDLGKTLKTFRTKKYLSVEEVSSITKIKDHYITALEEEDLENLPARVYTVGFLKNLADLYDLSSTELILSYDRIRDGYNRSHRGRQFFGTGKELKYEEEDLSEEEDDLLFHELDLRPADPLERVRSLSMEDAGAEDEISTYIQRSKQELEDLSIKKELARELKLDDSDLGSIQEAAENTYPTAKIMLEFEELMREEERFNTQKLRKMESERNINKAKNTMRTRRPMDMDQGNKNGAGLMILVLLVAAILVLLYIIITALISQ